MCTLFQKLQVLSSCGLACTLLRIDRNGTSEASTYSELRTFIFMADGAFNGHHADVFFRIIRVKRTKLDHKCSPKLTFLRCASLEHCLAAYCSGFANGCIR